MAEALDDAVLLGRAIAATRAELGLKRVELAKRARVSYPYLSELENGTKQGSTQKIAQIAEALGMTHSQLLARAESLGLGEASEPSASSLPAAMVPVVGPTSSAMYYAMASVPAGVSEARPMALRPLGRPDVDPEEAIVERVTAIVRAEISRWLDTELEPLVRRQVRDTPRPGG